MVRTHDFYGPVDMVGMYPNQSANPNLLSSFNFSNSDIRLSYIHDNGQEIFLRLGNSWDNSRSPTNTPNWIAAATNVIAHYTQGKWNGCYYPIRYVEIWNEPENAQFRDKSLPAFLCAGGAGGKNELSRHARGRSRPH